MITEQSSQRCSATTGSTNAATITLTFPGAINPADGKYHYALIAIGTSASVIYLNDSADYTAWVIAKGVGTILTANALLVRVLASTTSFVIQVTATVPIAVIGTEIVSDSPLILDLARANSGTGTTVDSGTTGTTNTSNELAVACLMHRLQNSVTTGTFTSVTNSFTEVVAGGKSTNNNTANGDREVDLLFKALTSTGTQNTSATVTGSNQWGGVIFTLRESGGGPVGHGRLSGGLQ